jgi:hypothetical protein
VLRIFCHADRTPAGELGLAYVNAIRDNGRAFSFVLVSLVPADLQPPTDPATGRPMFKVDGWHRHADRFRVDLKAPWTNVVCAPRVGAALDWAQLCTAKVRNVLLAGDAEPDAMADRYDAVAVTDDAVRSRWLAWDLSRGRPVDDPRVHVIRPDDAPGIARLLDP